jgi:hypothetical protein
MTNTRLSIAAALAALLCVTAVRAEQPGAADQATTDALLSTIRANRKALVATNLQLSDAEAAAFWPVYDKYQSEINTLGDRFVRLIEDYTSAFPDIADDKAMKLVQEYLDIEAARVALRRTYVAEFAKTLPGHKVARLYQIENKMDAVIRYDLAATIPVMAEQPGTPAPAQ